MKKPELGYVLTEIGKQLGMTQLRHVPTTGGSDISKWKMKKKWEILLVALTFAFIGFVGSHPAHAQNNCLDFDGTSDYVTVPDSDVFDFTSFTVEAWICSQDLTGDHVIIGKTNEQWPPASTGFDLETRSTELYGSVWDSGGNQKYIIAGTLTANMWQHVAMTWTSGGSIILYINGNNIGSQPSTFSGTIANAGQMKIGAYPWVLQYYWNGQIDEIRVWNTVRTEAQIRAGMYQEISDPSSEANLVAYYKFNETSGTTATDSKGSNNGTLTNMTGNEWQTSPAMFGPKNCLDFDGTDDYVDLTNSSDLKPESALTFECWINANDWNPSGSHQVFAGNTQSGGYNFAIGYPTSTDIGFAVFSSSSYRRTDADITGFTGWHHVAGTFDGRYVSLYIDGILSDRYDIGSTGNTIYYSVSNSTILGEEAGQESIPAGYNFSGKMDEVRFWNIVRTASEIRENMCKSLTGNESNLVAYYTFDNTTDTTLQDFSGNDNDGTLTNMEDDDWVSSSAFNTWLNTSSSSWSTASNWSRGSAPGSSDNVGIYSYSGGTNAILSGSPTVNHLMLGGSSSMTLSSGLTVNGNLILESDLDLNSQIITLGEDATLAEGSGRLYGASGTITTTRSLSNITSENVAGLGAEITTAADMGSTDITRGHSAVSAEAGLEKSIYRCYEITPTTNTGLNATLRFYYNENELNSIPEADLALFRWNASKWQCNAANQSRNSTDNWVQQTGIDAFSQWTLGDEDDPTLVNLISFTATGVKDFVQLEWETASEIDNAGFYLWRSETEDGQYTCINEALIPAEGGHTWGAEYEYEDFDVEPGLTYYYKLEDIDYSGVSTFHGPVSATVGDDAILLLSPEDTASVAQFTPLTFEWDGADLVRFKLRFSSDPAFKKKVMVVPLDKKREIVWIEEQFYTPSQKEWRRILRQDNKGKTVYWRVYGEDEAGEGYTSEVFGFSVD